MELKQILKRDWAVMPFPFYFVNNSLPIMKGGDEYDLWRIQRRS